MKRNIERFPERFMFQLSKDEFLFFQNGISSWGGTRTEPFAFTEQGVSMLSAVLRSPTAIQVSISIMDAFVALRKVIATIKENDLLPALVERIKALEEVSEETLAAINDLSEDTQKEFEDIYIALTELATKHRQVNKPRNPIGYVKPKK